MKKSKILKEVGNMWYVDLSNGETYTFDTELEMYKWLWEESQYAMGMVISYGRSYSTSDNLDGAEE